jgi:CheY-like chemotaxis protein
MLRGRILVVEDDPAIATVVQETLTAEAYEVVRTDAASALHPDPTVVARWKDTMSPHALQGGRARRRADRIRPDVSR